jgi:DNA-binding CsgD family transcriptional regulator/tetratricopeptide (TPR) repeat protein
VTTRGVFVGRQPELRVVSGALEAARAAAPQIVWIEGEPGIGKTAFLRRFLATTEDVVVLDASGEESETTLDFGVVSQLAARASASAAAALDELTSTPTPASPFSVGAELLGLFGALQDRAPVVMAVDDVQWIDSSSAGALLFALRRLHGDRVLVLIGSRPDGVDRLGPSWSRLLGDADRVVRVRLSGLSAPEVGQLANSLRIGPLTQAASERLRQHTDGHPLYVRALLSELPLDRLNSDGGELPAPHSFAATVLARLTAVSADAQNLVAAAAVIGARCPLALAGSVGGVADPLAALEEALAADLLTLEPARIPEEIVFPHPLVRAAVYDDLSPTRRRALHLACARLVPGSAALAHRVAASHGNDDELAAELEQTAEAEISAGRMPAGVERLMWASRIAATTEARETALLRAVECLVLAGEMPAARRQREAVAACGASPRRSYILALLTASSGRLAEAEGALRAVIAHPDPALDPKLEGAVTSMVAMMCGLESRGDEAVEWAHRALRIAGAPTTAVLTAREALAVGLLMSGRGGESIDELASVSASRIEPEPFEAELLAVRGIIESWWGDLARAEADLSAVIRWSRAGVPVRNLPNAYSALAKTDYRLGRWDDGLMHADVAISLGEESDRTWDLSDIYAVASYLNAARGNWSVAAEQVEAARRAAEATPLPMCVLQATVAAAHFAWVKGEWETLARTLAVWSEWLKTGPTKGLGKRVVQAMAAEAMLFTGRPEDAAGLLDLIGGDVGDGPDAQTQVDLWRLRAALAQSRGRYAEAQTAFERGREWGRSGEAPLSQGLLELGHGNFLRKQGSRRAAIAALRAAREVFGRLQAQPFIVRCDAELTACGVRSRDHSGDSDYGLTAREEVVARLVASGKSNREAAEELYLSTKAVEYHLGNVFAKVNVRSRHELASRLAMPGAEAGR